jgi:D-alanyl-D-alanine carboxypeptidase
VSARKAPLKIKGVVVTEKGDDLLVLVNKNIRLKETYEPKDLVKLDGKVPTTYFGIFLRKDASDALLRMVNAARKSGYNLVVTSGYRSYWQQDATFAHWVKVYGLTKASDLSARPGHSQHQLGTTIDFQLWQGSREYPWLLKNSYKYGFVISYPWGKDKITGYAYEPWHYRYIGVENAKEMVEKNLILEQFLQENGVW